jgi:hypothetical protein
MVWLMKQGEGASFQEHSASTLQEIGCKSCNTDLASSLDATKYQTSQIGTSIGNSAL